MSDAEITVVTGSDLIARATERYMREQEAKRVGETGITLEVGQVWELPDGERITILAVYPDSGRVRCRHESDGSVITCGAPVLMKELGTDGVRLRPDSERIFVEYKCLESIAAIWRSEDSFGNVFCHYCGSLQPGGGEPEHKNDCLHIKAKRVFREYYG